MKYKRSSIKVVEREPGKWHALITRALSSRSKPTKIDRFATSEHSSAVEAMTKAMEMIDVVSLTSNVERTTEKYWRCLSKADRKAEAVTALEAAEKRKSV
jgi:hypothetical protein